MKKKEKKEKSTFSMIWELTKRFIKSEFFSYCFFGGLTTLIYVIVKSLIFKVPIENETLLITIATTVAWTAGVIFAFITNKLFVFKSKSFDKKVFWYEFITFFGARVLSYFVDLGGSVLLIQVLNWRDSFMGLENIGPTLTMQVIVIVMNYIFSKLIIFKKKNNPNEGKTDK